MTPLDWTLAVTDVPRAPRDFSRDATPAELAALTNDLGILACTRLSAHWRVKPMGGGRYGVTGECRADVTQACVVTLEPVAESLVLPIDMTFVSADSDAAPVGKKDKAKPREDDEPGDDEVEISSLPEVDLVEDGRLEIGRVVFEVVVAGLNPYPRKPDATFAWVDPTVADSKVHPFAALAKLKTPT